MEGKPLERESPSRATSTSITAWSETHGERCASSRSVEAKWKFDQLLVRSQLRFDQRWIQRFSKDQEASKLDPADGDAERDDE